MLCRFQYHVVFSIIGCRLYTYPNNCLVNSYITIYVKLEVILKRVTTPTHPHPPPPSQNIPLPTFIPQLTDMLKYKLLFQTFTYLGWESSIKYLGGNQIETFTLTYNTYTSIHTRTFSFANYITDTQQTYITDITVNDKDIILRSLLNIYLIQGIV